MALDARDRLEDMTVAELRKLARQRGLKGYSKMKKAELARTLERAGGAADPAGTSRATEADERLPEMGMEDRAATPGMDGTTSGAADLNTDDHDRIRAWAEERDAAPATEEDWQVNATDGQPRVLLFRFPGPPTIRMQQIDWPTWFRTFDRLHLRFVYMAPRDGSRSNEFRFALR